MFNQDKSRRQNFLGFITGTLIGGLAGAITMLLLAPQSGEDTRSEIWKKGIELREQTGDMVDDTLAQVRSGTKKLTNAGTKKIAEIKHQSQDIAATQLDHVAAVVKSGKIAVNNA